MQLRRLVLVVAWITGAFAACTRVETTEPPPTLALGDGGHAGQGDAGANSVAGEATDGSAGATLSFGGAPGTVELGVWPTVSPTENESPEVAAVLASVETNSLGSATLPLYAPWDRLSTADGSPLPASWTQLDALTQSYRERGRNIALCIGIVDRLRTAWPFEGELGSGAANAAIERTVDEVYAHYAASLSHLCFGYDVDRYLEGASAEARSRLIELLEHAVTYAMEHPAHTALTTVGVAVGLDALARGDAVLDELPRGGELIAVYDPLDSTGELKDPTEAGGQLNAALDWLGLRDGEERDQGEPGEGQRKTLTLFEAGYPSSTEVGSSERAQRSFYESIFATLDRRIDEVSLVGLFGLGDRWPSECQAEAPSFDRSPELAERRALVRCSMGLRSRGSGGQSSQGAPRLAWPVVLSALSRYR